MDRPKSVDSVVFNFNDANVEIAEVVLTKNTITKIMTSIFFTFGISGTGWIIVNTIGQQIPYFESTQSEGYCLASYFGFSVALGALFPFAYLSYVKCNGGAASHTVAVPFCLFLATV